MIGTSTPGRQAGDAAAGGLAYVQAGGAAFWRINGALFIAGFATFATLYCVQPLLPVFAAAFGLSPAASSLALSVATAWLAVSMLVAGSLSEAWGRKPVMLGALLLSGGLTIGMAWAPSFSALLVLLRYPPEGLHRQGPAAEIQFNDLVVKCLIKLTKALSTTMDVSKKAAHFFPGPVGHCTDKASCT